MTGHDDANPAYKNVRLWIKLVADYSTRKFLTFPTYVGRGFVERLIEGVEPTIDFEPNETIQWSASKNAKGNHEASATTTAAPTAEVSPEIDELLKKYQ